MKQGRVYFPPVTLPPGQETNHRIVVLTNNQIINRISQNQFLLCAIIRSSVNQSGKPVIQVPGHTIPVNPSDFTSSQEGAVISHESLIETHQLFHIQKQAFSSPSVRSLGDLSQGKLQEVLSGAKRLVG